jgi:DamX protein
MRVDKDDRYILEKSNKSSTPSFDISTLFQQSPKKEVIIMGVAFVIIALLLCSLIFCSSKQKRPTPLTPPEVSDVPTTQLPDSVINNRSNDGVINTPENQISESTNNTAIPVAINDANKQQDTSGMIDTKDRSRNSSPVLGANESTNKPINLDKSDLNKNINANNNSTSVAKIKSNQYAIQLSSSSSVDGLKKLAKKHELTNYQVYETKRNDGKWYILVKGTYDSADEARKAIKSLPSELQKNKPWVKSGATINKEKSAK